MSDLAFLTETYDTERLKTVGVWAQFRDEDMHFRPESRARTPLEQMVHQCVSEDAWMVRMLGIEAGMPVLPASEGRLAFLEHYAEASRRRSARLHECSEAWFSAETDFFDTRRSRAWVLLRRIAHSAHHRGQLTVYLRLLGHALYSTYGPTADTGGLALNGATVTYRFDTLERLLEDERNGRSPVPLPGPGFNPPTERPTGRSR